MICAHLRFVFQLSIYGRTNFHNNWSFSFKNYLFYSLKRFDFIDKIKIFTNLKIVRYSNALMISWHALILFFFYTSGFDFIHQGIHETIRFKISFKYGRTTKLFKTFQFLLYSKHILSLKWKDVEKSDVTWQVHRLWYQNQLQFSMTNLIWPALLVI